MTIAQEEIFGPVLSIMPYDDEEEAVRIANDTIYGLAGGVWSADEERARRVAGRIRTGQVEINGGAFNPLAPFGGYKQSGHGRELGATASRSSWSPSRCSSEALCGRRESARPGLPRPLYTHTSLGLSVVRGPPGSRLEVGFAAHLFFDRTQTQMNITELHDRDRAAPRGRRAAGRAARDASAPAPSACGS